jgi:hypothetical protein
MSAGCIKKLNGGRAEPSAPISDHPIDDRAREGLLATAVQHTDSTRFRIF